MGQKLGEAFVNEKIDRGFRELGGLFYDGSNIAQPMYQLKGSYEPAKQLNGPEVTPDGPSLEAVQPVEASRDDRGKDRDDGPERE